MYWNERYSNYEAVIGIEVHVQLSTKTKIFCHCSTASVSEANTHICPICTGYPGVLPCLNKKVVEYAIKAGIGTNCTINTYNEFARKHYFYADLPKGYQITQAEYPICSEGYITIKEESGNDKKIRVQRIHMEEDAGKNIHAGSHASLVDFNRACTPLLEIVSYPDIANSYEARAYLKELHAIVTTLSISTGNMEEGEFRADANVSVRKKGETRLGTKCELKNINSFKFIADAIDYEIERQIIELEKGNTIRQQTRLWDTKEKKTYVMREKEGMDDYRYFPEPDIPPLYIEETYKESIKKNMPLLPQERRGLLKSNYYLTDYESRVIVDEYGAMEYYESVMKEKNSPLVISFILREIMSVMKELSLNFNNLPFSPSSSAVLIGYIEKKKVAAKNGMLIVKKCINEKITVDECVMRYNLLLIEISDEEITRIIKDIVEKNKSIVDEYKSGKTKLLGFFVGSVLKETKGSGDPEKITSLFNEIIK
jgi:aspartyl-tRNA(Asn)/glutamyl-tRNA(Gln) amidotransferase subunit B